MRKRIRCPRQCNNLGPHGHSIQLSSIKKKKNNIYLQRGRSLSGRGESLQECSTWNQQFIIYIYRHTHTQHVYNNIIMYRYLYFLYARLSRSSGGLQILDRNLLVFKSPRQKKKPVRYRTGLPVIRFTAMPQLLRNIIVVLERNFQSGHYIIIKVIDYRYTMKNDEYQSRKKI